MNGQIFLNNVLSNWKSGLTVSLISLPLAVTLAVASHATPVQGVITAIWAGLFSALFGGSNYNIIGPTGALSGLLASYAIIHGIHVLPTLAVMSGIILLVAYFLHLERYIVFVPSSTVHGFVLGIALIIMFNQINFAFGLSGLATHESFIANVIESITHISSGSVVSALIFILSLASLIILTKLVPQFPAALIVSPIGIIIGALSTNSIINLPIATLETKFSTLQATLFQPSIFIFSPALLVPALTIAIISILETIISARIADGMTKTKHNPSRELSGLSLANIASGLAGGIPATAALARTTLNIKSGCTHKISAAFSSIFIALIAFILLPYFTYMPLAVVAAILTHVGIQMIEIKHFTKMFHVDKQDFCIALGVATVTLCADPIIGILLGSSISMLVFMKKLSTGHYELTNSTKKIESQEAVQQPQDTFVYSIKGELAYINAQAHITRFETQLPNSPHIILDLHSVRFIDHDGLQACEEIVRLLQRENKTVSIVGAQPLVSKIISAATSIQDVSINT